MGQARLRLGGGRLADVPANGVTHPVAQLMVHSALTDQLAEDRRLAKGEVLAMYQNQLITPEEATAALEVIGFHGEIGKELLRLADFRRESRPTAA